LIVKRIQVDVEDLSNVQVNIKKNSLLKVKDIPILKVKLLYDRGQTMSRLRTSKICNRDVKLFRKLNGILSTAIINFIYSTIYKINNEFYEAIKTEA